MGADDDDDKRARRTKRTRGSAEDDADETADGRRSPKREVKCKPVYKHDNFPVLRPMGPVKKKVQKKKVPGSPNKWGGARSPKKGAGPGRGAIQREQQPKL